MFRSQNSYMSVPVQGLVIAPYSDYFDVVDPYNNVIVDTISLPTNLTYVQVCEFGSDKIMIADYHDDVAYFYDAYDYTYIDTINIALNPYGSAYVNGNFWVSSDSEVNIISGSSLSVISTIIPDYIHYGIASDGIKVMISAYGGYDHAFFYSANSPFSFLDETPTGSYTCSAGYGNGKFITGNYLGNSATIINASSLAQITNTAVGSNPYGSKIAYSSATQRFAVCNLNSNFVSIIDANTNNVVQSINVGAGQYNSIYIPGYFLVTSGSDYFWKINENTYNVEIIDLSVGADNCYGLCFVPDI